MAPRIDDILRDEEVNDCGDDNCEGGDSIVDFGSYIYCNRSNVCGNAGFKTGLVGIVVVKDILGRER